MSRHHPTITSLARRLRPASEDFAAAAALHDPSLLLQLQATQPHWEQSIRPAPSQHRRGDPFSIRRALAAPTCARGSTRV